MIVDTTVLMTLDNDSFPASYRGRRPAYLRAMQFEW